MERIFFTLSNDDILSLGFNVDSRNALRIAHEYLERLEVELDRENAKFVLKVLENIKRVERLKEALAPGNEMVTAALRFAISHPVGAVAIPGAKSPEQARMNTAAGDRTLTPDQIARLTSLVHA